VPGPQRTPKRRRGSVLTTLAGALAVTPILGYVVLGRRLPETCPHTCRPHHRGQGVDVVRALVP
jgi:hypothetical protein